MYVSTLCYQLFILILIVSFDHDYLILSHFKAGRQQTGIVPIQIWLCRWKHMMMKVKHISLHENIPAKIKVPSRHVVEDVYKIISFE